jgi:NitT/TauT family transport system substrate-binding protein
MRRKLIFLVVLSIVLIAAVSGCQKEEDTTLKMAVIPVLDTLPFYVAEQLNYFADEGIQVELVPAKSGQERDALLQAGEVDGMLTDVPGVGIFNRDKVRVKIVAMARKAYPDSPLFRLLAAPGTDYASPADLANVKIGISQNTVIEYITDRMLEGSGLTIDEIVIEEISAIPVRFEQLMTGGVAAATLPDPLAQGAIAAGATLVVDDSQFTDYSHSVLVLGQEVLEDRPETVRRFLSAWDKAAAELNAHPDLYSDLMIEKGRVPESIQGTYTMPTFPRGEITSESQWADIVDWLLAKGLVDGEIPYEDAVDDSFLP